MVSEVDWDNQDSSDLMATPRSGFQRSNGLSQKKKLADSLILV